MKQDKDINNKPTKKFFNFKKISSSQKKIIIASSILLTLASVLAYQAYSYKNIISNFKSYFDTKYYSAANNYILTTGNSNIFKSIFLEGDLTTFFKDTIYKLNSNLSSKNITNNEALAIINEINRYNLLDSNDDSISVTSNQENNSSISKGIAEYEKGNFEEALKFFNSMESSDSNYTTSLEYLSKCKSKIKENLLVEVKNYEDKEYFTAGINLIESKLSLLDNDKELINKIEDLKKKKEQYLSSNQNLTSEASASQLIASINTSNINTLDIKSNTGYLIYVDTPSQTTNVYIGSENKWNLEKTMKCSTGVSKKETPSGVFTVQNRDTWFFSEKYQQGGKYWVQFDGDYLFHSVPYGKDQETVLDTTLGKPASHGCIRLSLDDAKWLYDTVPKATKVIIK